MFKTLFFYLLLLSLSSTLFASSSLYKCKKANGLIEYRGQPCHNNKNNDNRLNPLTRRPWRGMMLDLNRQQIIDIYGLSACHQHKNTIFREKPAEEKNFKKALKQYLKQVWKKGYSDFKYSEVLTHYKKQAPSFKRVYEKQIIAATQKCHDNIVAEKIARTKESPNLLVAAASNGFLPKVKKILARGVDVDYTSDKDYYRNTALIGAAKRNQFLVVKYLLAQGANSNQQNMKFSTPLLEAAKAGVNRPLILELTFYGANINYVNPTDKQHRSILYWGIYSQNPETVNALLSRSADPNICYVNKKTKKKESMLDYAGKIRNSKKRKKIMSQLRFAKAVTHCKH